MFLICLDVKVRNERETCWMTFIIVVILKMERKKSPENCYLFAFASQDKRMNHI